MSGKPAIWEWFLDMWPYHQKKKCGMTGGWCNQGIVLPTLEYQSPVDDCHLLIYSIFHDLMALFPHLQTHKVFGRMKTHWRFFLDVNHCEPQKDRTGSLYHWTFLSLLCWELLYTELTPPDPKSRV